MAKVDINQSNKKEEAKEPNRILILGGSGKVAGHVRDRLISETDSPITLFVKNPNDLEQVNPKQERVINGDIEDEKQLNDAMKNQDIIYANLNEQSPEIIQNIIKAMQENDLDRIVFITGIDNILDENGKRDEDAKNIHEITTTIKTSNLIYTIIRAAKLDNTNTISYTFSKEDQPISDSSVSRRSMADLIVQVLEHPELHQGEDIGMTKLPYK